jgi:hypothetical protein
MGLNNRPHNREPEAKTFGIVICPCSGFEQPLSRAAREADSAVGYFNTYGVSTYIEFELDTAVRRAELTGIEDQIHQDLRQSSAVGQESDSSSADLQALAFASQKRLDGETYIGEQVSCIERLASQSELATRGKHQVVDENL